MLLRRLLLALGALALIVGIVLLVVSLRGPSPAPGVAEAPKSEQKSVLVAAKAIPAGSLLRPADVRSQEVPEEEVAGAFVTGGPVGKNDLIGAATRRDFQAGDPLLGDQIVRPNEPGFLPAALSPGRRAVTIAVNPAEVNAGLVTPGDRVDIILTQNFNEAGVSLSRRSAAETVLRNLRVIAIDQTINVGQRGPAEKRFIGTATSAAVPKTVTLEVTVRQAQELMLAGQLGKLQLSLRGFSDAARSDLDVTEAPLPSWASEVSQALKSLDHLGSPLVAAAAPATAAGPAEAMLRHSGMFIEVIRGTKVERRCFDGGGRGAADCGVGETAPATAPPAPAPVPGNHGTNAVPPAS
jgi:pilus assembly protein CpaB